MSTMDQALAAIANGKTLSTAQVTARLAQTTGFVPGQLTENPSHVEDGVILG